MVSHVPKLHLGICKNNQNFHPLIFYPLGLNQVNFLIVSTFFLFPCFLLFLFHFMFGMRAFVCEREIECLSVTFPQNLCLGQIPRGSGKKFSLENIYYIIQEFLSANIANAVFGRKKKHCNMTIFMFFRFSSQVKVSKSSRG